MESLVWRYRQKLVSFKTKNKEEIVFFSELGAKIQNYNEVFTPVALSYASATNLARVLIFVFERLVMN